ncbi:hypothetical protein Poly51_36100 [Rubripirellula tenax]|uniref:N-acetyltransferase domain-containing protein n=1 Tax=Rubripirellula tenax TaxID=2528015 RepID=A0A5C6F0H3_9BACT|nr:GNAT family N-acetyltransferase [Rubripirellula tenax]TWU54888.1 hypothetical protein Poly51_36100 [Rubripirellula tenax]
MIVAETERLTLRHASPDDAIAMRAVFCDPEVMRHGDGPQTDDWIQSWITRMNYNYNELGYGLWIVTQTIDALAIGYCGLTWFPNISGRPEIEVGYRLARTYWDKGYATEVAVAVRDLAFSHYELDRLIAIIEPDNLRSIRVAEKLGMQYDGDVLLDGYDHSDSVYACQR